MNEQKARHEGLSFTGIYTRSKEETKARIAQEREKYPDARIILVTVPDSKLSRGGGGTGYSACADQVYFLQKSIQELLAENDRHRIHVSAMEARHREELQQLDEKNLRRHRTLGEKQHELMNLLPPKKKVSSSTAIWPAD